MDVNMINPVLDSFVSILPQIGFAQVEKKGLALEDSMLHYQGLLVNIGVLGAMQGAILIGMELEAAKQFASKMMMGMEVAELDAMAQSAISEMANMVCANACTNYAKVGITDLDISPPTLLLGNDGQVRLAVPKTIVVDFAVDGIRMKVYVGLMRKS